MEREGRDGKGKEDKGQEGREQKGERGLDLIFGSGR